VNYQAQYQAPRLTPAVKALLIAMGVVFVLQLSLSQFAGLPVEQIFGFSPRGFLSGELWQIVTYPFLHGGLTHILFNALILYMLGAELEMRWGTRRFFKYYAVCAVGGALLQTLIWAVSLVAFPSFSPLLGSIPIIGASGALYGLFVAFGVIYGDSMIYVMFLFPMKARHFVMLLTAITIVSAVFYSSSGVAHLVHLGGMLTGYLYLKWKGPDLNNRGGGLWRRRKTMARDELRRRLNLIVNEDRKGDKDGKYPITWN
jgi:membrane associated rhomboid family serine protease